MIGQPELRDILAKNNLRQLSQRVTARYHLHSLSKPETFLYIEHRLRISGAQSEIFKKNAKREIYNYSSGIPRLINVICDRALLGGYGTGKRKIDKVLVKQAKREIQGEMILPKKNSWLIICSVITVVVCILIFHKIGYLQTESLWNFLDNFFSGNI